MIALFLLISCFRSFHIDGFVPRYIFQNAVPSGIRSKQRFHQLFQATTDNGLTVTNISTHTLQHQSAITSLPVLSVQTNVTLTFPSFEELMDLRPGQYVVSESFVCSNHYQFRVKLYPRGGGHSSSLSTNDGFGMAYQITSPLRKGHSEERVGMYLQFLGKTGQWNKVENNKNSSNNNNNDEDDSGDATVDATFALRLQGRQRFKRKFDVEWRAGMRFVATAETSFLNQGYANDFGAHLMQTSMLKDFLGISDGALDDATAIPVTAMVEVIVHDTDLEIQEQRKKSETNITTNDTVATALDTSSIFRVFGNDVRRMDGRQNLHDAEKVRVGKIVVPILSNLIQRPKMFEQGVYPGVEYRILRILKDGQERFTSCPGADYELKPIYPLVAQLERPWPVTVNEKDIPRLYTPSMYNIISAVGSLFTAVTGLLAAFVISQAISIFFIPSKSMDPTLQVGDVLLVDKVSPRLVRQQKVDDIILFSPPSKLQEIVVQSGGKLNNRDLFVKRIAAIPGDRVTVTANGQVTVNDNNVVEGCRDLCEAEPLRLIEKYIQPAKEQVIEPNKVFVMGDCSSVSVDSRVWGPLETKQIVGRPILRLWPLEKFGRLKQ
jgi:signal peptidase I